MSTAGMPAPAAAPRATGWGRWLAVAVVGLAVAAGAWAIKNRPPAGSHSAGGPPAATATRVEVVRPTPGGIDRVSTQPGTVEPFQAADLYAKASGFLAEQTVDIGSRVTAGQVLARISVPEYQTMVDRDAAALDHAKARVGQAAAKLAAAQAEGRAAKALIVLNETLVASKASYRKYRGKQLDRVKELLAQNAVDAKLVDESEDQLEAAVGAEAAAKEAITTARQQAEAADARVGQAEADRKEADAQVRVAEAELAKARVLLGYTTIVSPYDGVVTRRQFLPGDFIRSADAGGNLPLLRVERTDKVRVVTQIPDRDVPYVTVGDPVTVEVDALTDPMARKKRVFTAAVSRTADTEDPATRTMRTEVDVPNPDGVLRAGMYGRATVVLEKGAANAVTVPSAVLEENKGDGHAVVRVVRAGKVVVVPVRVGADTGIRAEVLDGLTAADAVIVRASGPVDEGAAVTAAAAPASPGH